jgi:hypothetical protein
MANELRVKLDDLAKVLGAELQATCADILDGAEEDLKAFALAMAADALRVLQGTAAEDVDEHLEAQAALLAEKHRIRIEDGALGWLLSALKLAGNVALKVGEKYIEAYVSSKIGG